MKILARITFDGSKFSGWQYQPGVPTVQGTLTEAASRLFGCACRVTGCSRTDAGVHAASFCATFEPETESRIPVDRIPDAINTLLPSGVAVLDAVPVPDGFHPRYGAKSKTYKYLISRSAQRQPLLDGRVFVPGAPVGDDALAAMDAAARTLEGKHDFASYMASGSKVTDTMRNMVHASVTSDRGIAVVTLTADGFLYNMVRIITGTLLEAGLRGDSPETVAKITAAASREAAGRTLPPYGLYLWSVDYGEQFFPDASGPFDR